MQTALTISPVPLSHWHKPTLLRVKMSDFSSSASLSSLQPHRPICFDGHQLMSSPESIFPTTNPAQIHPNTHSSGQHHCWSSTLSTASL